MRGGEHNGVVTSAESIMFRPVADDDADALQVFHSRLSDRSVYLRYLAPKPVLSDVEARHLTTVDHVVREAFVAECEGELIAIARYESLPEACGPATSAEVAFLVLDEYQGRGLARTLLRLLAASARAHHLNKLVAEVAPGNGRMLGVFRRWGQGCTMELRDGTVHVELDLSMDPDLGAESEPEGERMSP